VLAGDAARHIFRLHLRHDVSAIEIIAKTLLPNGRRRRASTPSGCSVPVETEVRSRPAHREDILDDQGARNPLSDIVFPPEKLVA